MKMCITRGLQTKSAFLKTFKDKDVDSYLYAKIL